MSANLTAARAAYFETIEALERFRQSFDALQQEEWTYGVMDLFFDGARVRVYRNGRRELQEAHLVPIPTIQEPLYLYRTSLDLLAAEAMATTALGHDFYDVGHLGERSWLLGDEQPSDDLTEQDIPRGRYLVDLGIEEDGSVYGIAHVFPFTESGGYGDSAALRRAMKAAPELFIGNQGVVWYEREDLTLAAAQELLRREAPKNSPVAAAQRLGFDVLEGLPRDLPILLEEDGRLRIGTPQVLLAIPLGPGSRPFQASGDLVLVAIHHRRSPERMWVLCRYVRADQDYSGASDRLAAALSNQGTEEALELLLVFGERDLLTVFHIAEGKPLPRIAVRFMDQLARFYAKKGHGTPFSPESLLRADDLNQLNLGPPFDTVPFQP